MATLGQRAWELKQHTGQTWPQVAEALGENVNTVRREGRVWGKAVVGAPPEPPGPHPSSPDSSPESGAPRFANEPEELPDLDELFKLCRASRSVLNRVDPIVTHDTATFDDGASIGVIFVSCAHLGSRYTFYEEFERIFSRVLDTPRLHWLSLGDDVEGFLPGFRDGSAVTDQAIANPLVQRLMLARVLDKLAERGKLLAGCASQHGGDWYRKAVGEDPIKALYLARRVPFYDGKGLLTLKVGRQTYQVALAHSFPGSSIYNANHAQRRAGLFDFPSADVIVQGDKHRYAVTEMSLPPTEFDAGLRASYMQWLVQVGTAKAGLDKYSIRGWSRGVLEWPVLIFHADRHCIEYTRDLERASTLLEG